MQLNNFQEEIISQVISSFEKDEKSVWLEMPVGSGKTIIAMQVVERLVKMKKIQSLAFVASTKILQSYFKDFVLKYGLESISKIYTYREIHQLIAQGEVLKNDFDIIVCDEAERGNSILQTIYKYFSAFKFSLARVGLLIETDFPSGTILRYDFEKLIRRDDLYSLDHNLKTSYFKIIENAIDGIQIGSEWNFKIKNELLNKVEYLKDENVDESRKIKDLLKSGKIDFKDISEISFKKEQLEEFDKLLHVNCKEADWQNFFEKNPWIFGFSLNFIFNSPLAGKKLEQTVAGYSIVGSGKRTDALLKTNGIIQSLCFGEIKTHKTPILNANGPYRSESWSISEELAGGIAQVQRTVQKSLFNIQDALQLKDEDGYLTKEKLYLYKPKAFLLIGSLNEFTNPEGNIHEEKFSSFEIFRRSIHNIDIITFDELFERANAIINKKWNYDS